MLNNRNLEVVRRDDFNEEVYYVIDYSIGSKIVFQGSLHQCEDVAGLEYSGLTLTQEIEKENKDDLTNDPDNVSIVDSLLSACSWY